MSVMLTEERAIDMVAEYMATQGPATPVQEMIDAGTFPKLNDFTVKPGKVSECLHGGPGSYLVDKVTGERSEYENPPLLDKHGVPLRAMVRSEKVSTHDIVRGEIPMKDQVLAMNHHLMLRFAIPYIGTSQHDVDGLEDNSVVIGAEDLEQIRFENVLRAFMAVSSTTTNLYMHWKDGQTEYAGHPMPEGLFPNGPLPYVMDTPSTKDDAHDVTVSPQWLFDHGVATPEEYTHIRNASLILYGAIDHRMRQVGVMLVDTKLEQGRNHRGEIVSQDEILTMDSSRWWLVAEYQKQLDAFLRGDLDKISPRSYSKEFARDFSEGEEGYNEEQRLKIAVRYIIGLQNLTGEPFVPDIRPRDERVITGLEAVLEQLAA